MMQNKLSYRLGLDIGTNSIGFALIELDNKENPLRLIHLGSRIFSDGREDKTKTSLAVARRDARGMRRRLDRYLQRRQVLMEKLIALGLMPQDRIERKNIEKFDPYKLRKKGLDEQLTNYELGRVLFHLNQRRGFQSNRKEAKDEKETGKIKSAIKLLEEKLAEKNYRTIGEFLCSQDTKRVRSSGEIYEFYPQREMLKQEYDLLLAKQAEFNPQILTQEVIKELKEKIFFQRPLKPVEKGKCSLIATETRAYSALPSSQRFRILKEVNNLGIMDRFRRNKEDLNDEQKEKIVAELYKKTRKFNDLRKLLDLDSFSVFNLETEAREKLVGAETHISLADKKCFGETWNHLTLNQQDEVVEKLLEKLLDDHRTEEELFLELKADYPNIADENIKNIMNVRLDDGTMRYSTKAIEKLLPHLEAGKKEDLAIIDAGFKNKERLHGDELPNYAVLLDNYLGVNGRIANPTVHIVLGQIKKLVNELVKDYGKPKEIAIEFARDLKMSPEEKRKYQRDIGKNQKDNEKYNEQITANGLVPSPEYRLRLKLHTQQNGICVYCEKSISISEVLSDAVEIDHILPFSKTLDDSSANKVVVDRRCNQIKGNRTPAEAFGDNKERISHLPNGKKWRFLPDAMKRFEEEKNGDAGWLARQLTDTAYVAKLAREYLRYLVPDRKENYPAIDTYPGTMTAKLRRAWGLNSLINPNGEEKNRDDHRHHAIDALVIACSNRSMLQALSRATGAGEFIDDNWLKRVPQLPDGFSRDKLKEKIDSIVISHKIDHGTPGKNASTSGRLHEDTFYGMAKNQSELKKGQVRLVVRKALSSIEEKHFADICDANIREKLVYFVHEQKEAGVKSQDAIAQFGKDNNIRRLRVFVEKSENSLKAIKDKQGKPYRWVATGGNHHIDIYCPIKDNKELKTKAMKWYAETVSTFDANQKDFQPQWRKDHPTAKLIMRLHINDMVAYDENGKREIRRVKKINGNPDRRIYLVSHLIANEEGDKLSWGASANLLQQKNARKISVTPSGKIYDAGKSSMPKIGGKIDA